MQSHPVRFPSAGAAVRRAPVLPSLAALALAAALAAGCDKREAEPAPQPPATALPPSQAPAPAPSAPPAAPAAQPAPSGSMDFSLGLKPVSAPSLDFAAYKGRKVLVFYFGPTCPHCQEALPQVQSFAETIKSRGVETIAVATSRSNPEEIREFIMKYSCRLPVFWDSERKFGDAYGVKVLPTLYMVGSDGSFIRNDGFDGPQTLGLLGSTI